MNLSQAFDKSLKDCGITGKWLSQRSGVTERMISNFRNSRQQIYSETLDKLLEALPYNAKLHFFTLLLADKMTLASLIGEMDEKGLANLLLAIADRLSPKKEAEDFEIAEDEKIAV